MENQLVTPGAVTVLGRPVDLSQIEVDSYVVAGIADHITPWQNCYRSTQLLGGDSRFILSTSGHIAALVNPPGNPKASYQTNKDNPADPQQWLKTAETQQGSWWPDLRRRGSASAAARRRRRPRSSAAAGCAHSSMRPAPTSSTAEGSVIMYEGIGRSLGTDYFRIADQLTDEELRLLAAYPRLRRRPGAAGHQRLLGARRVPVAADREAGQARHRRRRHRRVRLPADEPDRQRAGALELNRGDGSLGTFLGVQAGLAMQSIAMLGSEEQKQRWLPPMATLEKLGAFALTEPLHGSDSVALETSARRDGDSWVINGAKKWIGNGTLADVVVVWARDDADRQVKGFLVEKGTPGYDARRIDGKGSLRAVWQAEITLTDLRVPEESRLPGANSFKDTGRVLAGTRNAVAWARARPRDRRVRQRGGVLPPAHTSSASRW